MRDLNWWRNRAVRALQMLHAIGGRVDRACAAMNGGLAAVAVALAILVIGTAAMRASDGLAQRVAAAGYETQQ